MTKAQSLSGIYVPLFYRHRPQMIGESLRFLSDGIQSGTINASVATTLPLSRTAEAHRMLEERRVQGGAGSAQLMLTCVVAMYRSPGQAVTF